MGEEVWEGEWAAWEVVWVAWAVEWAIWEEEWAIWVEWEAEWAEVWEVEWVVVCRQIEEHGVLEDHLVEIGLTQWDRDRDLEGMANREAWGDSDRDTLAPTNGEVVLRCSRGVA